MSFRQFGKKNEFEKNSIINSKHIQAENIIATDMLVENVLTVNNNVIVENDLSVNGTIFHSGNFQPSVGTGNETLAQILTNGNQASTNIDMSGNLINDVSGIFFSDGTFIGQGNSFDISTNHILHLKSVSGIKLLSEDVYVSKNIVFDNIIDNSAGRLTTTNDAFYIEGGETNNSIRFSKWFSSTPVMQIDTSNGNVNIGSTIPSNKFQVTSNSGKEFFSVNDNINDYLDVNIVDNRDDNFSSKLGFIKSKNGGPTVNGSEIGYIDFYGKNNTSNFRNAMIMVNQDGDISGDNVPGRIEFHTASNSGPIVERMSISSNGNVGITGDLTVSQPTGDAILRIQSISGEAEVQQRLEFNTHQSSRGGGILWTDPSQNLKRFFGRPYRDGSNIDRLVYNTTMTGEDVLRDNCGNKLTIMDNGNVGIGTITPNEKLQVSGNIDINGGRLTFDNNGSKIRIGQNSGQTNQGGQSIAIGINSGRFDQSNNSIAIGVAAGETNQNANAVAIGNSTGQNNQGLFSISIGSSSGRNNQGTNAIAIGINSGRDSQGTNAIAIGNSAGRTDQHQNSIILNASGTTLNSVTQDAFYVAPIRDASSTNLLQYNTSSKEISFSNTLNNSLSVNGIMNVLPAIPTGTAILNIQSISGDAAVQQLLEFNTHSPARGGGILWTDPSQNFKIFFGRPYQGGSNIDRLVYNTTTISSENVFSHSVGNKLTIMDNGNVGIGTITPNQKLQVSGNIDIYGGRLTFDNNGNKVRVGINAGQTNQGQRSVAIGELAGQTGQGVGSVAIGAGAGNSNQSINAVAIGNRAGNNNQRLFSIAIGSDAGAFDQSLNAIAIGRYAGETNQGGYAIAIGKYAGRYDQPPNTIILNATGNVISNQNISNAFYVRPIRGETSNKPQLVYNLTNGEITYNSSSIKYKKNVIDLQENTSNIYNIRACEFEAIDEDNGPRYIGYIAEEINDVDTRFSWKNPDGTPGGIAWFNLLVYTIEELKKHKNQIEENKNEISILKNEIEILKNSSS
jgi:hypothetical protein